MKACMHTCMHTHTDTQTYIPTYRRTDIQTYRHTDMQTYPHTDMQTYRRTRACARIHIHVRVPIHNTYIHRRLIHTCICIHRCTHEYTHNERIHTGTNNSKGFPTCCCCCTTRTFPQDLGNSRHRGIPEISGFPQDLGTSPRPGGAPKTWGRPRSSRIHKSQGIPSSREFHISTECGPRSKSESPGIVM